MTQSGIHYDHDEVLGTLGKAEAEARTTSAAHARAKPALPSTAAGRDFSATAARLQSAFLKVHHAGQRRVDALAESLAAGATQMQQFTRTDEEFAGSFPGAGS